MLIGCCYVTSRQASASFFRRKRLILAALTFSISTFTLNLIRTFGTRGVWIQRHATGVRHHRSLLTSSHTHRCLIGWFPPLRGALVHLFHSIVISLFQSSQPRETPGRCQHLVSIGQQAAESTKLHCELNISCKLKVFQNKSKMTRVLTR